MRSRLDTALRISRRLLAEAQAAPMTETASLAPPAVSLDEAAASGQLCQAPNDHHWDRVFDHVWKCRRCGALTRTEHP